jgi:hypothetical protein
MVVLEGLEVVVTGQVDLAVLGWSDKVLLEVLVLRQALLTTRVRVVVVELVDQETT